jgi:tetratricopeptide repeat protein
MLGRLYGDRDHPEVARSLVNLARALRELGEAARAEALEEEATAMSTRLADHL